MDDDLILSYIVTVPLRDYTVGVLQTIPCSVEGFGMS
jgi:hypothetical protein